MSLLGIDRYQDYPGVTQIFSKTQAFIQKWDDRVKCLKLSVSRTKVLSICECFCGAVWEIKEGAKL